jgi:hypothetical protein
MMDLPNQPIHGRNNFPSSTGIVRLQGNGLSPIRILARILFTVMLAVGSLSAARSDIVDADWVRQARIAGANIHAEMTSEELAALLDRLAAQSVSVVQADSDLSMYLTEDRFAEELEFIRRFSDMAHRRGLRTVWYYPSLEVLSPDVETGGPSMFRDHPDWVQVDLNGRSNVFVGGGGRVHWVEEGVESAWMSIHSGYSDYLLERVARIAATGVDGIWLDVPLYSDIEAHWPDFSEGAKAAFRADTGLEPPVREDWNDPTWRRWIAWRHQAIADFLNRCAEAGRKVSENFLTIVENVTIDHSGATRTGLDGSVHKTSAGLIQVWEIDAVSDRTAMRDARTDDWLSLIAMNKFAKAASGSKPSWAFTYGFEAHDAGLVMAEALAAGNNPYETRIPQMATSVGTDYRANMFSWIKTHARRLFESRSNASVAILYSPESRDYLGRGSGSGLYATMNSDDRLWWSTEPSDSVYSQAYLAEHRGLMKWLLDNNIPFDTIVSPDELELRSYDTIVVPALAAISDKGAEDLEAYVRGGGTMFLTGATLPVLDEVGRQRNEPALKDLFDEYAARPANAIYARVGNGRFAHAGSPLGMHYLTGNDEPTRSQLEMAELAGKTPRLEVRALQPVHVEHLKSGNDTILQFVAAIGRDGVLTRTPASVNVKLPLPDGTIVEEIRVSSPFTEGPDQSAIFERKDGNLEFDLEIDGYSMVVVVVDSDGDSPANDAPVAGDDHITVIAGTQVTISSENLLRNDGDLDTNDVEINYLDPAAGFVGELKRIDGVGFSYKPPKGFIGSQRLDYEIRDPQGSSDRATVTIDVIERRKEYVPSFWSIRNGNHDGGSMQNLARPDNDTFEVSSTGGNDGMILDMTATTVIDEQRDHVAFMTLSFIGQYSVDDVEQTLSVFNQNSRRWEPLDTRHIGTGNNVAITMTIRERPVDYISKDSRVRLRLQGRRREGHYALWADSLAWEVAIDPAQ